MPGGVARRDDRVQNAAGALGQRVDADREENPAEGPAQRCPAAYQDRSLVSPDGEHQLSADDHAFRSSASRDDHSLLPGLVPDALYRPTVVHGIDLLHFKLLPGLAARTLPPKLASRAA